VIPLFIPYVNRSDLLNKAWSSVYDIDGVDSHVIDNSESGIANDTAIVYGARQDALRPPVPLTFAQSQNWMCRLTIEAHQPFYLFLHNDAEAGEGTVHKLIELGRRLVSEGKKWGCLWTNYDSLAAINIAAIVDTGPWDTNIPQYFCDNDRYLRFRLAGWECIDTGLPVTHTPSQTINSDPELKFINSVTFPLYEYYYSVKHGGSPGKERFRTAFNR
jgi:hypothetical protein